MRVLTSDKNSVDIEVDGEMYRVSHGLGPDGKYGLEIRAISCCSVLILNWGLGTNKVHLQKGEEIILTQKRTNSQGYRW